MSIHFILCKLLNINFETFGARAMAQLLDVLAANPEDWNSIPTIHMVAHNHL